MTQPISPLDQKLIANFQEMYQVETHALSAQVARYEDGDISYGTPDVYGEDTLFAVQYKETGDEIVITDASVVLLDFILGLARKYHELEQDNVQFEDYLRSLDGGDTSND